MLTFYAMDKKDTTQDIVGTKRTKQGHSGQKETIGTFEGFFLSRRLSCAWNLTWDLRASLQISIHETPLLWVVNL